MSNIVERLRSPANVFYEYAADNGAFLREAADEITRLRADLAAVTAERDRMREAVKPLIEIEDYPDTILMKRIRDLRAAIEGVTEPPR